nr:MAG TPA: hypothetical protein [Caudoviricetes sp.]
MFVILYNQRGECAEWCCIYLLVRFQPLLLLSNSFLILVSEYVTDKFIHSKSSCVCRS